MKKLSIICTIILAVGMMSSPAFAVQYKIDINPMTQDFQDSITLNESDTVTVDVWIVGLQTDNDHLISAGFFVPYMSDSFEILSIAVDGAWDGAMTAIDTTPPGMFFGVGQLSGAAVNGAGEIRLCALTVHCLTYGLDNMIIQVDPDADMVVSSDDAYIYDPEFPFFFNFVFNQVRCCDNDTACDDGIYCNGLEYCVPDPDCTATVGKCMRPFAIDCDDSIVCTDDACNEGNTNCDNIANASLCDDSIGCTVDLCDQLGGPGTGCSNTATDSICNDSNVCTDDACDDLVPGTGCSNIANNDPCDDSLYCNGADQCGGSSCSIHMIGEDPLKLDVCDDLNDCSDDACTEGAPGSCTNECNAVSAVDICCDDDDVCLGFGICAAGGVINIGKWWANCGDVGVKIDICLQNLVIPVGGFQMDLCENIDDCLICTECELTERTIVFDCIVNELPNGCCRVILFAKHPGGLINPGECDIVTIVYEIRDIPECCDTCIVIDGENIVLSDEYGYDKLGVMGDTGEVCPFVCGDVEPGCSSLTCQVSGVPCSDASDCVVPGEKCNQCVTNDCGDGDIDLFDILEEIGFALMSDSPDTCQGLPTGPRDDVPTGTPIILPAQCIDPDGSINILDVMVLIDMALGRQNCCDYWYAGIII